MWGGQQHSQARCHNFAAGAKSIHTDGLRCRVKFI